MNEQIRWLKELEEEGEAVAEYVIGYNNGYCIIPDDEETDRLDIAGCLEETLHRILDKDRESDIGIQADYPVDDIDDFLYSVMLAKKRKEFDEDEELIDIDLDYCIPAEMTSFKRVPLTDEHLQEKLYERYKLIWMQDHGYTLGDAFEEFRGYLDPTSGVDSSESSEDLFYEWENESGFSGSEYPCFNEFLDAEYQMKDSRMFANEQDEKLWERDQDPRSTDMRNQSFDCVLYECSSYDGFTPQILEKMAAMFPSGVLLMPVDITNKNGQSSAMGFIRIETAEALDYDLTPLTDYISGILEDLDKESENGEYKITLKSNYSGRDVVVKIKMNQFFF